jgi:anti-anti-sigma regulatory factor
MQSFADNGTGEISIDLRQVHSFNSPAVGALVMLRARRRRRGHGGIMHLVCTPTGVVTTMIQRARLDTLLNMKLLEAD